MRNAHILVGISVLFAGLAFWYSQSNTEIARNTDTKPPTPAAAVSEEKLPEPSRPVQGASIGDENAVDFTCAGGTSITAVFTRDIVGLTLSDGRQMTLREASSESGVRYLNNTENIEFRGGDEGASFSENGATTYKDCKTVE
jgi:membrane-bound inhibitor of C-type lysozyme